MEDLGCDQSLVFSSPDLLIFHTVMKKKGIVSVTRIVVHLFYYLCIVYDV